MEEVVMPSHEPSIDKRGDVILNVESLTQLPDKCSGSPKLTKALSRKGSNRTERRCAEELEIDEGAKRIVVKVCSQLDQLKQPLLPSKVLAAATATNNSSTDGDVKSRRFNRFIMPHPKKILLLFATMSCIGTLILICCTLAINRKVGA